MVQGKTRESYKTLALGRGVIYRKQVQQPKFEDFYLSFGGKLHSDNRGVRLTKLVPREEIENQYVKNFADSGMGEPAKAARKLSVK